MSVVSMMTMPSASSVWAAFGSIQAITTLTKSVFNDLVPFTVRDYVVDTIKYYFRRTPKEVTIIIDEKDDNLEYNNDVYYAAETYLSTRIRDHVNLLKLTKSDFEDDKNGLEIKFAQSETIEDSFQGVRLEWLYFVTDERKKHKKEENEENEGVQKRCFELSFDKKHKNMVLDTYIPFVLETAKSMEAEKRTLKLHTLACRSYGSGVEWKSITLDHPSTFDTLAMDSTQKKGIVDDLERFLRRKEFYRKVGKAWKRGYLLYGPPGTGKSSLIAAMANYLKFDIYDLELTNVRNDSELRKLLLNTANRSILVIEDIDCSVELQDRTKSKSKRKKSSSYGDKISLSGLLNFTDGLWSSCGNERILIFTTNHKEKLDPALIRPGRMDMHINMTYLTMGGFKALVSTYLSIKDDEHPLFQEIEELLGVVNATPAQVAEELMQSDHAEISLQKVIDFLKFKKDNPEQVEDEESDEESDKDGEDSGGARNKGRVSYKDGEDNGGARNKGRGWRFFFKCKCSRKE